jgi:2-polyprenyl-3-methyl-5-hydroxy-6-metoxy-1,4-benzoquinol methylase
MSQATLDRPVIRVVRRPVPAEFKHYGSAETMEPLYAQVMREAASMIPVPWDNAVVLDVACGRRQYVVDHLWNQARVRVGADISFDAIAANTGVKAACADMYALPFRSESCDVVVSLDTIEHAATPDRFLDEVTRVLRPNGSAVLITPNLVGYHAMVAKAIGNFGAELVWRVLKGRSLPFDLFYRANTIRRLRALAAPRQLRVENVVYVPCIQHFFWPYAPLRRFFMRYHHTVTSIGMPSLLPTMIVQLRKC